MNQIKAIETRYKGYRFRSRLEARWAVFFDQIGLLWEYESQGFEVDIGSDDCPEKVRYLPDFYLPKSQTWVEVKGSDELLRNDVQRLTYMLDWKSPIPGITDSACTDRGLLILGEIPWINGEFGIVLHPLVQHEKGLSLRWGFFREGVFSISDHHYASSMWTRLLELPETEICLESDETLWTTKHRFVRTPRAWRKVLDAYVAARASRFEHGESGAAAR